MAITCIKMIQVIFYTQNQLYYFLCECHFKRMCLAMKKAWWTPDIEDGRWKGVFGEEEEA